MPSNSHPSPHVRSGSRHLQCQFPRNAAVGLPTGTAMPAADMAGDVESPRTCSDPSKRARYGLLPALCGTSWCPAPFRSTGWCGTGYSVARTPMVCATRCTLCRVQPLARSNAGHRSPARPQRGMDRRRQGPSFSQANLVRGGSPFSSASVNTPRPIEGLPRTEDPHQSSYGSRGGANGGTRSGTLTYRQVAGLGVLDDPLLQPWRLT